MELPTCDFIDDACVLIHIITHITLKRTFSNGNMGNSKGLIVLEMPDADGSCAFHEGWQVEVVQLQI